MRKFGRDKMNIHEHKAWVSKTYPNFSKPSLDGLAEIEGSLADQRKAQELFNRTHSPIKGIPGIPWISSPAIPFEEQKVGSAELLYVSGFGDS